MMFSLNLSERRGQLRRMLSRIFAEPIEIAFASELGVEVDRRRFRGMIPHNGVRSWSSYCERLKTSRRG